MKTMYAIFGFYGCSCGCTPSQYIRITSDTKEGIIYGLADQFCNYSVYGNNPFRKAYIFDNGDSGVTREEVIAIANQLIAIKDKMADMERQAEKEFVPPYTAAEGYDLTKEQVSVNEAEKSKHEAEIQSIKNDIGDQKKKLSDMYVDHDTHYADDDEDDYEGDE